MTETKPPEWFAIRQVLVGQRDAKVADQCDAVLAALAPRLVERERAAKVEALDFMAAEFRERGEMAPDSGSWEYAARILEAQARGIERGER